MKTKLKTSILVGLMVISVFAGVPALATAQGPGWDFKGDPKQMPDQIFGGLAGAFSMFSGLGPSGAALGQVLSILFQNIMDFQITQFKDVKHVYVLNATSTNTTSDVWSFNEDEFNFIWQERYQQIYSNMTANEAPYVRTQRSGTVNITYTTGASIVFLIWDNNDSFVTAINKIITAAQNVKAAIESGADDETLITMIVSEIVEAITYLFFHINDIIDGDELIVLNMITWESITMDSQADYVVSKTYKVWDDWNLSDDEDIDPLDIAAWTAQATAEGDEFMQWLMVDNSAVGVQHYEFSKFSFNLIEIWLKTFQIHINVDKMMNILLNATSGGSMPEYALYEIFQGFEIDIYIITHSLWGFIAYDDVNLDGKPSVVRTTETDPISNATAEIVTDSEAEYYFVPKFDANAVLFHEPIVVTDSEGDKGVKWGVELNNVELSAVPIGMSYQDYTPPSNNTLDYIELGFTFIPKLKQQVDPEGYSSLAPDIDTVKMSKSVLKLDQYFADWGPMGAHLAGLDFAVVYMSTIVHFHIKFAVEEVTDIETYLQNPDNEDGLVDQDFQAASVNASGTIKIGDETGGLPVAGVDIAGPGYYLNGDAGTLYPASTTTIPLAWMNLTANAAATYVDSETPSNSFQVSGFLNLETSILIYAVSYPEFNGSGAQIDHDPTFSVFMTWDNPGFWAVILVVAGITLVAVAAILITRRKNRV